MPGPVTEVASKLEATAASFVKEHRLPGAAVGVVHGDDLVWSAGIGFADRAAGRAQGSDVLHAIASITKTFTGTAIMQLRDEGRLHLDDPAVAYLPELRGASSPFGAIETVTIRRLLSHESGLKADPPGADWALREYEGDPTATLARASELGTTIPANAHQKYSNLGYQLLGEIVTRAAGVPARDYVRANVLDPLGMASTAFDPLEGDLADRSAVGYAGRWMSDELPVTPLMPPAVGEIGLWSTVADLARWISAQFRVDGGAREGSQILAGGSLEEMQTPRYLAPGDAWEEAWGISWYALRRKDTVWVQHSGGVPGHTTCICFRTKERVGAIALLNGVAPASTLAMDLGDAALAAVREAPAVIEAPAPMPEAFAPLLGLYADTREGLLIRLEFRDGKLAIVTPEEPEWRPCLTPTADPDVFVVDRGWRESGEPAVFRRREDGRVRSVHIASFSLVRLDPVE